MRRQANQYDAATGGGRLMSRKAGVFAGCLRDGDRVIFRKPKVSDRPGPGARDIHPSPHGESYRYVVDKYWVISRELDEARVEVVTRKGKRFPVERHDPRLRKAGWLERLLYRDRFPMKSPGAVSWFHGSQR